EAGGHGAHGVDLDPIRVGGESAGQGTGGGANASEVRPEGVDPQGFGVFDWLDTWVPWWCGSDGGKVKGGQYHEEVIVSRAVGKVAGRVPVGLVAVGVDDEDRRPRDPAPLARIPQPDRSEDPFATRVTVDRERQPPSSRQGGVPPGRVDRDGDDLT